MPHSLPLHFFRSLLFLTLLSATSALFAQTAFDPAARVAAIAPFLDEHTIAVGHVDLKRLDAAAALKTLGDLAPPDDAHFRERLAEMEAGVKKMLQALDQAGIRDLYVVVSLADVPQGPPFIVAPLKNADTAATAAELLHEVLRMPASAALHGSAVCGSEAAIERLKTVTAVPRPELVKAFELAGDTAAQFVFSPGDDTRRVLREMLPRLPDEIGGGSGKMLADGVQWAVVSANAPPKLSLNITVQSKDEDSAAALRGIVMSGIQVLREKAQKAAMSPEEREATDAVVRLVTPQLKGDQLVISHVQDDQDVQTLFKAFIPAVHAARMAAGRNQSSNNLKQIALAMHNYHDTNTRFPPQAIRGKDGKPLLSWRVAILPYLGQQPLYQQFHLDEPWDSEHNRPLVEKMPAVFASPNLGDALAAKGMTSYVVPLTRKPAVAVKPKADEPAPGAAPAEVAETIFDHAEGSKISKITDGTSNTILVLEANPKSAVIWSKPDDLVIAEKSPLAALRGQPNAGFNAAFADGSVRFISESVDPKVFWLMILMNDGNPIPQ